MGRRLRTFVHVHDDAGRTAVFGPADEVPEWAAALIVNPKAWADEPAPVAEPTGPATGGTAEPPKSGRGSSREAWAVYAQARGLEVPDDASREEIVAAVEHAREG